MWYQRDSRIAFPIAFKGDIFGVTGEGRIQRDKADPGPVSPVPDILRRWGFQFFEAATSRNLIARVLREWCC